MNALSGRVVGLAALILVSLSACAGREMSDLEQFVTDIKGQKTVTLATLPETPVEVISNYSGFEHRDPFESFDDVKKVAPPPNAEEPEFVDVNCVRPDMHRNKEALESFPLDSLTMVGTLAQGDELWALIEDPERLIYKVKVNNYMGQNYGQIISITENKIELTEKYDDDTGCFLDRTGTLVTKD